MEQQGSGLSNFAFEEPAKSYYPQNSLNENDIAWNNFWGYRIQSAPHFPVSSAETNSLLVQKIWIHCGTMCRVVHDFTLTRRRIRKGPSPRFVHIRTIPFQFPGVLPSTLHRPSSNSIQRLVVKKRAMTYQKSQNTASEEACRGLLTFNKRKRRTRAGVERD